MSRERYLYYSFALLVQELLKLSIIMDLTREKMIKDKIDICSAQSERGLGTACCCEDHYIVRPTANVPILGTSLCQKVLPSVLPA